MDDTGNFTVVWQSLAQDVGGTWGIYAQRYHSNGIVDGAEFRVNPVSTQDQAMPQIAMDLQGNAVIVWQGFSAEDSYGIYARLYNSTGTPVTTAILVNTSTNETESAPSVGMDEDGNFVVVWESDNSDGDGKGVFGRRFDSAGVAQRITNRGVYATGGTNRTSTGRWCYAD